MAQLGVTRYAFKLLDVYGGEHIFFNEALTYQDGILEVVSSPRHKGHQYVAPQRELTHIGRLTVCNNLTASYAITDAHKKKFAEVARAAGDAHPKERLHKLVEGCSQISSCAAGCSKAMEAFVYANPAERMAKLSSCKALVKAFPEGASIEQVADWFWAHLTAYAKRAGVALPPRRD